MSGPCRPGSRAHGPTDIAGFQFSVAPLSTAAFSNYGPLQQVGIQTPELLVDTAIPKMVCRVLKDQETRPQLGVPEGAGKAGWRATS